MGHTLYFDVATSRFVTDKSTGEQPRVIRIAYWRSDEPSPSCCLIIPPPGLTIDPRTTPYHGLNLEQLIQDGMDGHDAIAALTDAAKDSETIVSFNQDFHWRNLYQLMEVEAAPPDHAVCAMKLATPILAIPAMRPGGRFKSPSLREACEHFNIEPPSSGNPILLATSTVSAVRGVYEACQAHNEKGGDIS